MIKVEAYFVLIRCDIAKEDYVSRQLSKKEYVKDNMITYGDYDIVARIEANGEKEIKKILKNDISGMKEIMSILPVKIENSYEIPAKLRE